MASGDKNLRRDSGDGIITGTGSDLTIICGFKPKRVEIYNTTNLRNTIWLSHMGDGKCLDQVGGTLLNNGITPLFNGFIIGNNTVLNNLGDTIYWYAQK